MNNFIAEINALECVLFLFLHTTKYYYNVIMSKSLHVKVFYIQVGSYITNRFFAIHINIRENGCSFNPPDSCCGNFIQSQKMCFFFVFHYIKILCLRLAFYFIFDGPS